MLIYIKNIAGIFEASDSQNKNDHIDCGTPKKQN